MEGGERIKASGRRFEKGRIGVRVEGEEDSHGRCVIPGRETEGEGEREREREHPEPHHFKGLSSVPNRSSFWSRSKPLLSISLSRPDLIGGYTGGVGPNSPL